MVEVKTTLTQRKVTDFLQNLKDYRHFIPCQEERTIYAVMACLNISGNNEKEKTKYGKENYKDRAYISKKCFNAIVSRGEGEHTA